MSWLDRFLWDVHITTDARLSRVEIAKGRFNVKTAKILFKTKEVAEIMHCKGSKEVRPCNYVLDAGRGCVTGTVTKPLQTCTHAFFFTYYMYILEIRVG